MPELVETLIEDERWNDLGLGALAERAAAAALTHLGLAPEQYAISLLACDDAAITRLNASFRQRTAATNVLSWPSAERAPQAPGQMPPPVPPGTPAEPTELGDIAIAYDTCRREAEAAGKPPADHVTHLVVHATLHLLGFDHVDDRDAAVMEELERRILASLGVPDPY